MSTTIKIKCIDQTLTYVSTPTVASGGKNEDTVIFDFCSKWDGFTDKTGVFYRNKANVYYSLIDENNTCIIPHEVLKDEGTMYFGVFGVKDDVTRTSEVLAFKVVNGAITEDLKPSDPTQDIYEQILSKLTAIQDLSTETLNNEQAFEKAITEQQESYETDLNNRWNTYKTNLNGEWSTYKTDLTKQQTDYETLINSEFDEYKATIPSIAISAVENIITAQELALGTSWTQDTTNGYYTQTVSMSSIKATDTPVLDVKLTGTADNIKALSKEWSNILKAETLDGSIKFYAKKATSATLTVLVKVG